MSVPGSFLRAPGCVVRVSPIQGDGVFAGRPFLTGEVVLIIDDSDEVDDRARLTPAEAVYIDVFITPDGAEKTTRMKMPEKLVNHSCDPNIVVETDMRTGIRRMVALRDIALGSEITWDYAVNIWQEWIGPLTCRCGAADCRRVIQGNFFTLPEEVRRRYIPLLDEPFKIRFARELGLAA